MTANTNIGKSGTGRSVVRLLALGSVLALLVAGALWWFASAASTHVTAYFSKAVGLYAGSTVRVLGIEVGRIDQVHPQGDVVRTELSIDPGVSIPAGAQAVVVAPSLVSDRYVQLTPGYTGGPKMASGAVIPLERTVTPMELDDLYRSANELSLALGPQGANKEGALSRLLDAGAANLQGNGQNLNDTIRNLGDAARTLEGSKGDLFATVDNLDKFTKALVQSDSQIHQFNSRFADVTGSLAQDSEQMGNALNSLSGAMTEVDGFIKDNRSRLTSNVDNLTDVSKALVDQRAAIAEILDVAPLAMANFVNAYDAPSGSVAVRLNMNEFTYPPIMMACLVIKHSTPKVLPQALADTCTKLAPVLDGTLKLPSVNELLGSLQQGKPPPLPLPLLDVMAQQRQAAPPPGGGPR